MVQPIQPGILNRVFKLICEDKSTGTTFTMECNDSQFLVTAKHIFEDLGFPKEGTIGLLTEGGKYTPYEVDIRYPADPKVDIAVMRCKDHRQISPAHPNPNTSEELEFGQDVFFLGFPYDYDELSMSFPTDKRPIPFIRKACFTGRFKDRYAGMFLDGHNDPGFSGGPVCYRSTDAPNGTMSIAAVISRYRFEKQAVLDENGRPTGSYVESNTGIIAAYDIKEAVQVAERWDDSATM